MNAAWMTTPNEETELAAAGSGTFEELIAKAVTHARWCDVVTQPDNLLALCDCGAQLYRERIAGQYEELKTQLAQLTASIERYKSRSSN